MPTEEIKSKKTKLEELPREQGVERLLEEAFSALYTRLNSGEDIWEGREILQELTPLLQEAQGNFDDIKTGLEKLFSEKFLGITTFDWWLNYIGKALSYPFSEYNPFSEYKQEDIVLHSFDVLNNAILKRHIINSDEPIEIKAKYLEHHEVLKHIPNSRNFFNLQVPFCNESWLKQVSEDLDMKYSRFKEWLDLVVSTKKRYKDGCSEDNNPEKDLYSYEHALCIMAKNGIDVVSAFKLRDHLKFSEAALTALKGLINSNESLERKVAFLEGIKGYEYLLSIVPPINLNAEAWIKEADGKAKNYFRDEGIGLSYPSRFLCTILDATQDSREELIKLARLEAEGKNSKKLFQPGKIYGKEKVFGLNKHLDPVDATRLLLYGLISKKREKQLEASKYFMPRKLSKARAFIERSHTPPTRLYGLVQEKIKALENCLPAEEERKIGESIIPVIKETYLNSSSCSEGKTELRELVWLIESLYNGEEIFDAITVKMQDGTLPDLTDGKRLLCCAMVSKDREKTEIESLYYCLDPYIGLMHIVPSLNGTYGLPIGVAILANTRTDKGDNVLLVDSMEGGVLFEQINPKTSFGLATKGIAGVAYDSCSQYIFFNTKTEGTVPTRYNSFIQDTFGFSEPVVIDLTKLGADEQPTTRKSRFLEAFEDKVKLAGPVKGYMIKTTELADAIN